MLTALEQEKIMRLAGHLMAAATVLANARRSPLSPVSPKSAEKTLKLARETLRQYLKEVG